MNANSSEQRPLVSIVIVNYNGRLFIEQCLKSVLNTRYPKFEVILVDNGSTDGSLKLLEHLFGQHSRLRIFPLETNMGFAAANNIAISKARGKYVALLNLDTEVKSNWLTELVRVAESDYTIGACQSKLLVLGAEALLDGAGDFPTRHGVPYIRGYHDLDSGYTEVEEVFSARAAAMMVRQDVVNEVGAFDDSYFLGCEDVDLCWRIRLAGYKVVFVPRSIVSHLGGGLTKNYCLKAAFHKHKNCIMTALKNYNRANLLKNVPFLIIFRLMLSVLPLKGLEETFGPGPAGVKALFWVIKNLPEICRKRLFVQGQIRKVHDSNVLYIMPDLRFEIFLLKWCLGHKSQVRTLWEYMHSQFKFYARARLRQNRVI